MNFREDLQQDLDTDPEFRRVWNERAPYRRVIRALVGERIHLDWTQSRLAKQMGTSQANLSRAEARGEVSADFLYRFATAVGGSARLVLDLPATGRLVIDMARLARRQHKPTVGPGQVEPELPTEIVTEVHQPVSAILPNLFQPSMLHPAAGSEPPAWWPEDLDQGEEQPAGDNPQYAKAA